VSSRSISITLGRVEVDRGISMANVGAPGRGGNMEHIREAAAKGPGREERGKKIREEKRHYTVSWVESVISRQYYSRGKTRAFSMTPVREYIVQLRHRAGGPHSKARYIDFVDA